MKLSKMIAPLGRDFKVRGMSEVFRIQKSSAGNEYIYIPKKNCAAEGSTYAKIINAAPDGITVLPLDITDDERAQLGHVYALRGRYMAYSYGCVFAYTYKPLKVNGNWECENGLLSGRFEVLPGNSIVRLVSPEDDEPLPIGKLIDRGNSK